jgi:Holliday junction resolvase
MTRYRKGANAERELIHVLFERGFSVVRVAGSGKTALPAPDLIALRHGRILAFESKAWAASNLSIPALQMNELVSWSNRAGAEVYIAWKVPHKGWFFLKPAQLKKTPKAFTISRKNALRQGIDLNVVIGEQSQLEK